MPARPIGHAGWKKSSVQQTAMHRILLLDKPVRISMLKQKPTSRGLAMGTPRYKPQAHVPVKQRGVMAFRVQRVWRRAFAGRRRRIPSRRDHGSVWWKA